MGNTAQQCRLGLFQDSDFAGDLKDLKIYFRENFGHFRKPHARANKLDVQETDFSFTVGSSCQASEHEEILVASTPEYLKRIGAAGKHTDIVWRLRRQLPGRSAGHSWVGTLGNSSWLTKSFSAVQRHRSSVGTVDVASCWNCASMTSIELGRRVPEHNSCIKDLSREIEFKGGDGCVFGPPCEHLKRLRTPPKNEN